MTIETIFTSRTYATISTIGTICAIKTELRFNSIQSTLRYYGVSCRAIFNTVDNYATRRSFVIGYMQVTVSIGTNRYLFTSITNYNGSEGRRFLHGDKNLVLRRINFRGDVVTSVIRSGIVGIFTLDSYRRVNRCMEHYRRSASQGVASEVQASLCYCLQVSQGYCLIKSGAFSCIDTSCRSGTVSRCTNNTACCRCSNHTAT